MQDVHAHHWVIETPNGNASRGVCACGAEREFANYIVETPWAGSDYAFIAARQVAIRDANERFSAAVELVKNGNRNTIHGTRIIASLRDYVRA